MNVDIADFDNDGWLDIYVTNITDEYMKECNMLWSALADLGSSLARSYGPRTHRVFVYYMPAVKSSNCLRADMAKWLESCERRTQREEETARTDAAGLPQMQRQSLDRGQGWDATLHLPAWSVFSAARPRARSKVSGEEPMSSVLTLRWVSLAERRSKKLSQREQQVMELINTRGVRGWHAPQRFVRLMIASDACAGKRIPAKK
jgi:hypothetical protein